MKRTVITLITAAGIALSGYTTVTRINAEDTNTEENNTKTITVTANGQSTDLCLNDQTASENINSLLGEGWYYGVTANDFYFNGESETNFAVKNFIHQGGTSGGQTGVTDKGQGSQRAFIMAGSVDSPFMVKGINAQIISPETEKEKYQNSTNNGESLDFVNASEDAIGTYVDSIISTAESSSARLSQLNSITDYSTAPEGKMEIDITNAGNNTVYINADEWDGFKNMLQQSSGITIKKNPGQKIVINLFDSDITLQKMVIIDGGTQEDTTGLANHSTMSSSTAEDLIFNMPEAANVSLNDSTGVFLAPNAEVHCYGVDGGWVVADQFVNNCEWHFINGSLPSVNPYIMTMFKTSTPEKTEPSEPAEAPENPAPEETTVPDTEKEEEPSKTVEEDSKEFEVPEDSEEPSKEPEETKIDEPKNEIETPQPHDEEDTPEQKPSDESTIPEEPAVPSIPEPNMPDIPENNEIYHDEPLTPELPEPEIIYPSTSNEEKDNTEVNVTILKEDNSIKETKKSEENVSMQHRKEAPDTGVGEYSAVKNENDPVYSMILTVILFAAVMLIRRWHIIKGGETNENK